MNSHLSNDRYSPYNRRVLNLRRLQNVKTWDMSLTETIRPTRLTLRLLQLVLAACCVCLATTACVGIGCYPVNTCFAADATAGLPPVVTPSIQQRLETNPESTEPDFQRHVLPLLMRLGCSGRDCHGAFAGQGGFQLSLFGYDFEKDYLRLTDETSGRIDRTVPAQSLILRKPSLAIPHEGGQRFEPDSWQYRLLLNWIRSGAKAPQEETPAFRSLQLDPPAVRFSAAGETVSLRAMARWSDGSVEDVTPLCRFETHDDSVAVVDSHGAVRSVGPGDTHIVAYYDNGVGLASVILPVSNIDPQEIAALPAPTRIDQLINEKLSQVGIMPSEQCSDTDFLRRVRVDLTATLPSPAEVESFLADPSPNKRARKIDALLQEPTHTALWTTKFCDLTGDAYESIAETFATRIQARMWYDWLFVRVAENMPYDQLVERIVVSQSRLPGQTYDDYIAMMSEYHRSENPRSFAEHPTLPMFWGRSNIEKPTDKALYFAYSFLGVRLQCAECHKHPFDRWSQDDFNKFQEFFSRLRFGYHPEDQSYALKLRDEVSKKDVKESEHIAAGHRFYWREVYLSPQDHPVRRVKASEIPRFVASSREKYEEAIENGSDGDIRRAKGLYVDALTTEMYHAAFNLQRTLQAVREDHPQVQKYVEDLQEVQKKLLDLTGLKLLGGDLLLGEFVSDPRITLMDWLRSPTNPYFSKAIVNRVWAHYFGRGIVDPPDDLNLANAPSNGALLDYLASEFVAHNYDLRWLHREIVTSLAYQRSSVPTDSGRLDAKNFSHAEVRRLPAEVVYDSFQQVLMHQDEIESFQTDLAQRSIGPPSREFDRDEYVANMELRLFGAPDRKTTCDCDRSSAPGLAQSLYRVSSVQVSQLLRRSAWLRDEKTAALAGHDFVEQAYLRILNRFPTEEEVNSCVDYLEHVAVDRKSGQQDIAWSLLNTKEFMVLR